MTPSDGDFEMSNAGEFQMSIDNSLPTKRTIARMPRLTPVIRHPLVSALAELIAIDQTKIRGARDGKPLAMPAGAQRLRRYSRTASLAAFRSALPRSGTSFDRQPLACAYVPVGALRHHSARHVA